MAMLLPTLSERYNTHHIDVLDGVRAVAILLVLWFHLWQQSWLMPLIRLPFLTKFGLPAVISLDFIPRSGFLFVDMLLLLSAFCLFLPHARAMLLGEAVPDVRSFYKKRLVRIVPPYCFSVLVIFLFVALPSGAYANIKEALGDLVPMLTFTQTFIPRVLLTTKLNGVLWTAAIEMQFYLFFPLLAACFRRKPFLTWFAMTAVSMAYLQLFALPDPDGLRTTLNQLPAFFGVFANGMLAAYGYVWLSCQTPRRRWISALAAVAVIGSAIWIVSMLKAAPQSNPVQVYQASHRFRQSVAFTLWILGCALSANWFHFLLGNRIMRFLAAISYNLYIWHQWLFVKLKEWRIPYWAGETPPNFTGDAVWQRQYTWICLFAALIAAVAATYLVERPAARLLQRGPSRYKQKKEGN